MDITIKGRKHGVNSWREKLSEEHADMKDGKVKELLREIYEIEPAKSDNRYMSYFDNVAAILEKLKTIELDSESVRAVNLISDVLVLSESEPPVIIQFSKMNLKVFHSHRDLLRSSVQLENFVRSLCHAILRVLQSSGNGSITAVNVVKCQLIIIVELQKLFPEDKFRGNVHLIKLFISCLDIEIDNFIQYLENIMSLQLKTPTFYRDILSLETADKNEELLRYCHLVICKIREQPDTLLTAALTPQVNTNFLCQLIEMIGAHLHLLETDADFYETLIDGIEQILCASTAIPGNCFETVEKFLIREILCNRLGVSVVCFDIMWQLLSSIDSAHVAKSYFLLFQDIILKTDWNGGDQVHRLQQSFIVHILTQLHCAHAAHTSPLVKPELKRMLESPGEVIPKKSFSLALSIVKREASTKRYRELVDSIGVSSVPRESLKDFCQLVQAVAKEDWIIHAPLVVKIIDYIIALDNLDTKIPLLLKLSPREKMRAQQIPVMIKYKLIQLNDSLASKKEWYENLKNYLNSLAEELKKDNFLMHQLDSEKVLKAAKDIRMTHVCRGRKN